MSEWDDSATDALNATIQRREELTWRLVKALAHFPREKQIAIITSFFSLDKLQKLVEFQER
jgi:hypothetical protein